ncbi:AMP-binding protein [Paenibacillus sp. BSR1-1]|uniref:AMP-binding protein n=1 Tax=Paenibacillus sp. BSR1-1 TaxID=3020845 RepID=UPI0025B18D9E|nr:AMP-binding protein [Paenibacillus sp. BSR1-1]MDN3016167.1 AMP-binding protein [Paenibacillus sp. BSR1-1]
MVNIKGESKKRRIIERNILEQIPQSERILFKILERKAIDSPDQELLRTVEGKIYTYADVNSAANQLANGLWSIGVRPNETVCWMLPTSPDSIAYWFALSKCGTVEICINEAYRGEILQYVLNDSKAKTLIIHSKYFSRLEEIASDLSSLERIVIVDEECQEKERLTNRFNFDFYFDTQLQDKEFVKVSYQEQHPAFNEVSTMIYTSGTTGPSKGVMISHHMLFFYGLTYAESIGLKKEDIIYHFLPFFHVSGRQLVGGALISEAKIVLRERFSVSNFWKDIRNNKCTQTVAVGGTPSLILAEKESEDDGDNPLEVVWAVPALPNVYAAFEKRFNTRVTVPFGGTEMTYITKPDLRDNAASRGSSGCANDYFELKIVDHHDNILPRGETGEIVVRPKIPGIILKGYWNKPESTLDSLRNAWYHTGDLGYLDEEDYLFFTDRKKDSIRRRGENISSAEVENIISKHEQVVHCAAVPVAAEHGEDEVKVCLTLKSKQPINLVEFIQWCFERMPYFMTPRFIDILDEMPLTALGKIEKYKLGNVTNKTWDIQKAGYKITREGLVPIQQ